MKDVLVGPAAPLRNVRPLDAAIIRLKDAELRVTKPRVALLSLLIDAGEPVVIEKLHAALKPKTCDLVTVYRCLSAFEKIGLVRRSFRDDGTSLWELASTGAQNYYVTCRDSNRMARISNNALNTLDQAIEQIKAGLAQQGYTEITHSLQFFAAAPSSDITAAGEAT